jgi:hypothetical protein
MKKGRLLTKIATSRGLNHKSSIFKSVGTLAHSNRCAWPPHIHDISCLLICHACVGMFGDDDISPNATDEEHICDVLIAFLLMDERRGSDLGPY